MSFRDTIRDHALDLGFNLIGFAKAQPSPYLAAYENWIAANMHGEMGYLARPDRQIRRRDLNVILPNVQSMIIVGMDYAGLEIPASVLRDPLRGRISNYAWGVDYHDIMTPRLEQLAQTIHDLAAGGRGAVTAEVESRRAPHPRSQTKPYRVYVDTGAILERSHAQQAGLGFIGKNTMLIHPKRGSFFFLGEILTTLPLEDYDTPHQATMCGNCTRCLEACPTNAFPKPYTLDARKCISYLTIELKTEIPEDLRPQLGNWIYGCDVCQAVCPYVKRFAPRALRQEAGFAPIDIDRAAPPLSNLLTMTPDDFKHRFAGSPIIRIKYERLLRNACVAAGNAQAPELRPYLENIAHRDDLPLAASHAQWALEQY